MQKTPKKHRKLKIALASVLALLVLLSAAFFIYTSRWYRADEAALAAVYAGDAQIVEAEGYIACLPPGDGADTGYIFYPGGLVDEKAYLPYLAEVAQQGYLCAVVKAPFHLAMFAPNAANKVKADYPDITTWVVGGHSLGGVAAAGYAANNGGANGLVLLAAYPSANLSASGIPVLSITSTADEVLNRESFEAARTKLPVGTEFLTIEGGNHSGFGAYGQQKGDGAPGIPQEEQRAQVAKATADFLAAVQAGKYATAGTA